MKENDPYTSLYEALGVLRGETVTPEDVAAAVADTIEQPEPPLRVPVGVPAERVLRARKEAPESEPLESWGRVVFPERGLRHLQEQDLGRR